MKIEFQDKSYIEFIKSTSPGKIIITIVAKDEHNKLSTVANSVEITEEQFKNLSEGM